MLHARAPDGREVAVKRLLRPDATRLARFERERRLLATFGEAEGFVPLLDAGTTEEGPFLVMPLVTGGTLRTKLAKGPLAITEAVALGRALASALAVAHARGVVHRDLKPENVLLTDEGRPLVTDLGLAKHFLEDAPGASASVSLSRTGTLLGTAGYMPHEQMLDGKSAGPAADVFALGAILYECLAGRPAFVASSVVELMAVVGSGEHPRLDSLRSDVPRWLDSAIERCLAQDPADRFPDGAALCRALGQEDRPLPRPLLAVMTLAVAALATTGALALLPSSRESPPPVAPLRAPSPPPPADAPTPRVVVAEPHKAPIVSISASPFGRLATGSEDGTAKLWDTGSGAFVRTFTGHAGPVRCVAVTPAPLRLLATADRATARIWDVEERRILHERAFREPILIAFAGAIRNPSLIVATEDGQLFNWTFTGAARTDLTVADFDLIMNLPGPAAVAYQFMERSISALVGGRDGSLLLQDLTGTSWRIQGRSPIVSVSWNPEGRHAVTGAADGTTTVWAVNATEGRALASFKHGKATRSTAISHDESFGLSGSDDGTARLFRIARDAAPVELGRSSGAPVKAVALVPASSLAIVARGPRLELWETRPGAAPGLVWTH